eukprot:1973752-Prymnesium_polylepis.1
MFSVAVSAWGAARPAASADRSTWVFAPWIYRANACMRAQDRGGHAARSRRCPRTTHKNQT